MPDLINLTTFKGISRRLGLEGADPKTVWTAQNLDLDLGGGFSRRDGLRKVMDLDPASVGLYAVNGALRAAIPGGQGNPLHSFGPLAIQYDHLSGPPTSFSSRLVRTTPGSDRITLASSDPAADWPAWAVGGTITITTPSGPVVAAITATGSAPRELVISVVMGGTGTTDYPFALVSGLNTFDSISLSLTNGSPQAVLVGANWPADVRDCVIRAGSLDTTIIQRISNSTVLMAAPWPSSTQTGVGFEAANIPSAYPEDQLISVRASELMGVDTRQGGWPYIVVERWKDPSNHAAGTSFEHHWIKRLASSTTSPPLTYVTLPFSPGATLAKSTGRLFASDHANGVVRFSSVQFGPTDWSTVDDAGFLPTLSHVSGQRDVRGLGFYDGLLAVIYPDSVQLWTLDPDPANIRLSRVLVGPGTENANTVQNVLGDLFYFTAGGFRSLRTQTISGKIQEQDDIGGDIVDLTKNETANGVAVWSQKRGQYLCAFGSRIYALRYAPMLKVRGWTTWELGVPVDYMVEVDGILYIRSGNALYKFEEGYEDGSEFLLETQFLGGRNQYARKRFDWVEVMQEGKSSLKFLVDPRNTAHYLNGPTLDGSSSTVDHIPVGALTQSIRVQLRGSVGRWNLAQLALRFTDLRW